MNTTAGNLDGHALAARYEALRKDVVEAGGCRHTGLGLALFVRKGMAAWMNSFEEDEPMRGAAASTASPGIGMPEGIERSLINILAGMALATALEGVR